MASGTVRFGRRLGRSVSDGIMAHSHGSVAGAMSPAGAGAKRGLARRRSGEISRRQRVETGRRCGPGTAWWWRVGGWRGWLAGCGHEVAFDVHALEVGIFPVRGGRAIAKVAAVVVRHPAHQQAPGRAGRGCASIADAREVFPGAVRHQWSGAPGLLLRGLTARSVICAILLEGLVRPGNDHDDRSAGPRHAARQQGTQQSGNTHRP